MKEHAGQSEDIAKGFSTLLIHGDASRIAWDWLRAVPLAASDARSVGLPPSLDQSSHLVAVLRVLGMLSQEVDGKILVLMVDEGARLVTVAKDEAIQHWVNAFRLLAEGTTRELGFIISGSFADFDRIVPMLSDEQIVRRFGADNYLQLPRFDTASAKDFVSALLETWIADDKRTQLLGSWGGEADGEPTIPGSFPFTESGLDKFVEYACRDGGVVTPARIQQELDNFVNRAMDDDRHVLSSGYVGSLIAGGGP